MSRVVIVGGGFAGLSQAARLAKLRHDVTLVEQKSVLGGRLRGHVINGQAWHLDPETVTLPGVLRDLFRKSGRPLEQVLDLQPFPSRRHIFGDKSILDLPFGNRADQADAVTEWLGADQWTPWVDSWADHWDAIRRGLVEQVEPPTWALRRTIRGGTRLSRHAKRSLKDQRLRAIVLDRVVLDGHLPETTPAFVAVDHYVERNFGLWRPAGGLPALADALDTRVRERAVDVRTNTFADRLEVAGDRVTGVVTNAGTLPADIVVWCAPRTPSPQVEVPAVPAIPAARTLIRLGPDAPPLPLDIWAHGTPPLHLWSDGSDRWTIAHHNAEDPLNALVRVGLDLRKHVTERHDMSPVELVTLGGWGWQWHGWRTGVTRPSTAFKGTLFFAGANARPGTTIEMIGSATAAIAERLGKVPR
jgi:UDP-galactopyranose mutase